MQASSVQCEVFANILDNLENLRTSWKTSRIKLVLGSPCEMGMQMF